MFYLHLPWERMDKAQGEHNFSSSYNFLLCLFLFVTIALFLKSPHGFSVRESTLSNHSRCFLPFVFKCFAVLAGNGSIVTPQRSIPALPHAYFFFKAPSLIFCVQILPYQWLWTVSIQMFAMSACMVHPHNCPSAPFQPRNLLIISELLELRKAFSGSGIRNYKNSIYTAGMLFLFDQFLEFCFLRILTQ